uniref:RRM domain-containing protein n=1 Tax=Kwoniella bestiolae CBS 10118 TaxID=1296100 RepID=A0A1B9G3M4_9TREE|nr:hypothetical protein I302_05481 [Kwoniella bestiolae CBS 10118]OCF25657.1 hypothetical protein I302_05481 [Kwoniella bestiolae CBS 10118]
MNEPMDIDLSLDEIIAKKRSEERASRRSHPYERATTATQPRGKPSSNRSSSSPVKTTLTTLSFTDVRSSSFLSNPNPSTHPSPHSPPLPSPRLLKTSKTPSREVSVAYFPKDVTPSQIRDMIQSTVGSVQELRLDSRGVAWVRMLRFQGWEVWSFLNGKVLDGTQRLVVRVYPVRHASGASHARNRYGSRRKSG